mgnify:CR=1 FL=1
MRRRSSTSRPRVLAATSIRGRFRSCPVNGRNWMALALLGARQPHAALDRTQRHPAAGSKRRRGARVPAERRRPAGVGRHRHRRPGEVQPGLDRRVPVRREPFRRDDGPVDRRAGERDHQVGQQPGRRACSAATSATASSTRRTRSCTRVEPIDNQQFSTALGGPIVRTSCTTSATTNTSASRGRASSTRRTRSFNIPLTGTNNQKKGGIRLDYQLSSQTRLMGKFSKAAICEPFGGRQHRLLGLDRHEPRDTTARASAS